MNTVQSPNVKSNPFLIYNILSPLDKESKIIEKIYLNGIVKVDSKNKKLVF
jgi:hypothetical protein